MLCTLHELNEDFTMQQNVIPQVVGEWLNHNHLTPATVVGSYEQVVCVFPKSTVTLTVDRNRIKNVRYSPAILPYS